MASSRVLSSHETIAKNVGKHMRETVFLTFWVLLFTTFTSYTKEYPKKFKVGTFKTTTELNTVKYLYRNFDYQYIYSEYSWWK